MVAYVVRKYQEEVFDASPPIGDLYLYAIRRWYRMIMQKTVDLTTDDGEERRGVYFMPVWEASDKNKESDVTPARNPSRLLIQA